MKTIFAELALVLFETSRDALLLVDPETQQVLEANPGALRLTGFTLDQLQELSESELLVNSRPFRGLPTTTREMPLPAEIRSAQLQSGNGCHLNVVFQCVDVEIEERSRILILIREFPGDSNREQPDRRAQFFASEADVLERLALGADLSEVLNSLVLVIEQQFAGMQASILLFDSHQQQLRHGAAPNLPSEYCRLVDGMTIGPLTGSCGTAAFRRERVIVEDILASPLWAGFRELAVISGQRSCWSQPVFAADGRLLGTFALYYSEPRQPTAFEIEAIESAGHLAGIAIDRRLAEDALRESEYRFRQLAENIDSAFWVYDEIDATMNYVSPAYERIFGRNAESMTHDLASFLDIVVPADRDLVEAKIRNQQRGQPTCEEYRIVRSDGSVRWIRDRAFPVRNETGNIVRMVGVADDVTDLKAFEQKFQEHREALAQVSRLCSLSELGANLAHELNQPLAAIANFAYVGEELATREETDRDRLREIFSILREQTERTGEIMRRVRALTTQSAPRFQSVNLADVVQDALQLMEPEFRRRRVQLSICTDETLPPVALDAMQIQQVLTCLARNAVDVMLNADRPPFRLWVETAGDQRRATVIVRDSGPGFGQTGPENVFDRLLSHLRDDSGTGLRISRSIVEAHGGSLVAANAISGGSEFRITLPLKRCCCLQTFCESSPREQSANVVNSSIVEASSHIDTF